MEREEKLLKFLLFFIIPANLLFPQQKVFTLEDAIHTALSNNREILVAKMDIQKSEAAVSEAFGYALPSFDIGGNFSHFIEKPKMAFPDFEALLTNATYEILFSENVLPRDESKFLPMNSKLQSFALSNSFQTQAQITQILFNSAVFTGIGASQIYLELSRVRLKSIVSKTIFEVKRAFYGVLLAKELYLIMEASLKNSEESLANIKALLKQGMVSEFDALKVEVQVENIRPVLIELENAYENVKNQLKIVLGIDQSLDIEVLGQLDYQHELIPDEEDMLTNVIDSNLDIQSLKIKKQVDEEFIAIERSDYWPTISAFGNFTYAGSSDNLAFQTYNSTMVGLSFSMNLFRGGRASNRVEQAEIAQKQTERQIEQLIDFTSSQVKSTFLKLKKVHVQIESVTRNVEMAEKAYSIAVTKYNEGSGIQLEVKNADIELRNARVNKLRLIHDYIISKAEMDKLLGSIREDYLKTIYN